MYKEMRRKDRLLSDSQNLEILRDGSYGVLSTLSEDGAPYGVPVNYIYLDGRIFFHSADQGHKLDNIEKNKKVSFTIVLDPKVIPDKFTTKYRSLIAFGKIAEVKEGDKYEIYKAFIEKFSGDYMESGLDYIKEDGGNARVFQINIDYLTGKGNI